ncbi:2-phosphosulfolactate phosphatase [Evansella sp. AB-rgal1]|uniref:2-phosphosulfolactate phosphatase n=1 Tax=Evansella sp. AB-rgal1 TaxID=3242696 RepID=UPI00359E9F48
MQVEIIQGNDKKLRPSQINIVIHVIRAFSFAHYSFIHRAKEILLVKSVKEGFQYKNKFSDYLMAGEVQGLPIEG